jgi:hypothetical protein
MQAAETGAGIPAARVSADENFLALVLGLGATPVTCHTAADHITVLDQTLAQLPDAHRR